MDGIMQRDRVTNINDCRSKLSIIKHIPYQFINTISNQGCSYIHLIFRMFADFADQCVLKIKIFVAKATNISRNDIYQNKTIIVLKNGNHTIYFFILFIICELLHQTVLDIKFLIFQIISSTLFLTYKLRILKNLISIICFLQLLSEFSFFAYVCILLFIKPIIHINKSKKLLFIVLLFTTRRVMQQQKSQQQYLVSSYQGWLSVIVYTLIVYMMQTISSFNIFPKQLNKDMIIDIDFALSYVFDMFGIV